jgi:uncharacterized protein YyaL (SSP411 family)
MRTGAILIVTSILGVIMIQQTVSEPPAPVTPGQRNRLAQEKSPYLLQHADNPVDWYPWGEEAFARARQEDRPIFLSIGYATCHWCHVMEHESFEDEQVARLMNQAFVCIKVDREERPDIDQVYMTACQLLSGSGGWPLTIIMTPDRKPFFAATYLPRQSRHGRIGMLELIPRVQEMWRSQRREVLGSAQQITGHLQAAVGRAAPGRVGSDLSKRAFVELAMRYDPVHCVFGEAPKFPSPHTLIFLLRYWHRTGDERALRMAEQTLTAMRRGGIYDHIGFGFHRYSTDRQWLLPHFEKMLYDQAMMVLAYTEALAATGKPEYEQTIREVLQYVSRELSAPDGAFYSAEDADSEGEEGKYYVWSLAELQQVLGSRDAELGAEIWNATAEGNFREEASGSKTGSNILYLAEAWPALSERLAVPAEELAERVEGLRERLLTARGQRVRPLLDDKILSDWNGLMAAAMARAGRLLGEPGMVEQAGRAVDFVLTTMRDADGRLLHRFRQDEAAIPAFLDDYAFLTWALIELFEAAQEPHRLQQALDLQAETIARFWDREGGGFYFTADDTEALLVRPKEVYDGAIPSGSSVAMANLVRLSRLTGSSDLAERADKLLRASAAQVEQAPSAHAHMVAAQQMAAGRSLEVVIAGDPDAADTRQLVQAVRSVYAPDLTQLLVASGEAGEAMRELVPMVASHVPVGGRAAAYVCRDFECLLPTTDPEQLRQQLAGQDHPEPSDKGRSG